MEIDGKELNVEKVGVYLNKKLVLSVFIVSGLSLIFTGFLAYLFSETLLGLLSGLLFGITLGLLINYFLLVSDRMIKKVSVELICEEKQEELHTVMKKT
ncbi:MAG: hypothetical protein V5A64_03315 [Candidatus Thermoplasmatota archaeon]